MTQVWCEVDTGALAANVRHLKGLAGARLAVAVKANAYGHGAVLAARAFLVGGADWLCVHALEEARDLRTAGLTAPIYVMGPVPLDGLAEASALDLRLVVFNPETVTRLVSLGVPARLHLKLETGMHRQGVSVPEALALAEAIDAAPSLELEGVASHLASADAADDGYARGQVERFEAGVAALRAAGYAVPMRQICNSAATLRGLGSGFELARVGIAAYGLRPSDEVTGGGHLRPALSWRTVVGQVHEVPAGGFIGYGCTYQAPRASRVAVLPVGYYDGYDRGLSNLGQVLVRGQRAAVRGRICMNLAIVDVTEIPGVVPGDEVTLLGAQASECVSADEMARWAQTINYEIVTRIGAHVPRRPV